MALGDVREESQEDRETQDGGTRKGKSMWLDREIDVKEMKNKFS